MEPPSAKSTGISRRPFPRRSMMVSPTSSEATPPPLPPVDVLVVVSEEDKEDRCVSVGVPIPPLSPHSSDTDNDDDDDDDDDVDASTAANNNNNKKKEKPFSTTTPILERMGGDDTLRTAVDIFYEALLRDDDVNYFFDGYDMDTIKKHQYRFMKYAFTELPPNMDVTDYLLHKHMDLFVDKGLNETHFDVIAKHFIETLQLLHVPFDVCDEALDVIVPLRGIFVKGAALMNNSNSKQQQQQERHDQEDVESLHDNNKKKMKMKNQKMTMKSRQQKKQHQILISSLSVTTAVLIILVLIIIAVACVVIYFLLAS